MPTQRFPTIDYLVIGHLACDRTPYGNQLGGTAAYSALTASALGQRAGLLTAAGRGVSLNPIDHLPRAGFNLDRSTTFENIPTSSGRTQILHHHAPVLHPALLPSAWHRTPIVHIAPIVHEIDPDFFGCFPNAFIGLTPQGYLRQWDADGFVSPREWREYDQILPKVQAAVLSIEDVAGDEGKIKAMADVCKMLVVTEGEKGARLFVDGKLTYISTTPTAETDATGAGDIFAAAFFIHLYQTDNPIESAYFATGLASKSVTRMGLAGIPTSKEIHSSREIIEHDTYLYVS